MKYYGCIICALVILLSTSFQAEAQAQEEEMTYRDTLVVAYNISPPFFLEEQGQVKGPSAWLWKKVAEDLNIKHRLVNVNLDSLLKGLVSGDIDVGVSPLTITSTRSKSIDFSLPYHVAYSSVLVNEVSTLEKGLSVLASFFSVNFFRALGILVVVILVFGVLAWLFERKGNPEEFGDGIKGLWSSFWWSAVTMTTVGYGDKSPQTVGGRIVALIWMFTAILIVSSLTASIASSLTINQIDTKGNTIEDFKNKKLGTIVNSSTDEWLKDNFYPNRVTANSMDTLLALLEKGEIDGIAYDKPILQNIVRHDSEGRFHVLKAMYNPQFYAVGFNKRLPESIRKRISVSILSHTEDMDWKILLSEHNLK